MARYVEPQIRSMEMKEKTTVKRCERATEDEETGEAESSRRMGPGVGVMRCSSRSVTGAGEAI